MKVTALLLAALAAAPLPAQTTPPAPPEDSTATSSDYIIGVEDVLSLSVWKEIELSKSVNVRPDGKVSFPLVGDLQAAGKTPRQLSQAISEALAKYIKEPLVTVTVEQVNSFKVYLLGELGRQGELILKRRTRLLQAIAQAGGLSPYASKNVVVVREESGREVRTVIDYRKVITGERPELNIYLKPGDVIIAQ